MSDAAYDVALGVLRGFTMGEEVGSQALAVVESQNQALQERAEKAEALAEAAQLLEAQRRRENQALQERAEKAEEAIRNYFRENGAYVASDGEWATAVGYDSMLREHLESLGEEVPKHAAAALSPTQETDPE